jgi:hypothetical protein
MEMLNRRGGPVDKGPPDEQRRAAEKLREEANRRREVTSHGGSDTQHVRGGFGRTQRNENPNSPRFHQRYRTILRPGGAIHDYAGGTKDVFVKRKPESGGTGNHPPKGTGGGFHDTVIRPGRGNVPAGVPKRTTENVNKPVEQAAKPRPSTYDTMARDLATRRATQNRPNAKRKLFAAARTASYGRVDSNRPSRMPSVDQLRRRAQRLQRPRGRSYS